MKCDAVVLAAGYSSRMGAKKMELSINNTTVLGSVIETLLDICGKIVVVGGHGIGSIRKITEKYENVELVENKDYALGMFSSVKRGVSEMNGDFFLIPGDYPAVKESTYRKLMEGCGDFIVPVYKGRKGHPVLIRGNLIPGLLGEPIESNLKVFRDKCNVAFINVDDEGILLDIDTPEDYENIKKIIGRGNQVEN
ncbi:MAG: nucleotidyltransferase family protein [Clostridia bacterium]|nr:nucleotidyltransferase family protein [Clostridia bacterium]